MGDARSFDTPGRACAFCPGEPVPVSGGLALYRRDRAGFICWACFLASFVDQHAILARVNSTR